MRNIQYFIAADDVTKLIYVIALALVRIPLMTRKRNFVNCKIFIVLAHEKCF